MDFKRILWLEDQDNDFPAYRSALYRSGRLAEIVNSVSDAVKELKEDSLRENADQYTAIIFDIKVLPGDDPEWIEFDQRKKKENPEFDPCLGLELLKSLLAPDLAEIKINPPISILPEKIIVLTAVHDKAQDIAEIGVPEDQIIYKAHLGLDTLPNLIEKIE